MCFKSLNKCGNCKVGYCCVCSGNIECYYCEKKFCGFCKQKNTCRKCLKVYCSCDIKSIDCGCPKNKPSVGLKDTLDYINKNDINKC